MKDQLLNIYKKAKISHGDHKILENNILISFNDGAKVEVLGKNDEEYNVKFNDPGNNDSLNLALSTVIA